MPSDRSSAQWKQKVQKTWTVRLSEISTKDSIPDRHHFTEVEVGLLLRDRCSLHFDVFSDERVEETRGQFLEADPVLPRYSSWY